MRVWAFRNIEKTKEQNKYNEDSEDIDYIAAG